MTSELTLETVAMAGGVVLARVEDAEIFNLNFNQKTVGVVLIRKGGEDQAINGRLRVVERSVYER